MHGTPAPPTWIRTVGILTIIFDVVVSFVCVAAFLITLIFLPSAYGTGILLAIIVWPGCFLAGGLTIFQIFAATGLLRPRKGARILFLFSTGGMALLPALISVYFILIRFPSSMYAHPAILFAGMVFFAAFLVCLVLFTRPAVVAALDTPPPPAMVSTVPNLPPQSLLRAPTSSQDQQPTRCPTPVLVVAILLTISGIRSLLSLFALHQLGSTLPAPVFFFGAVFRSETARLTEMLIPILLAAVAVALLLLNRFALDLILMVLTLRVINTLGAIVSISFVHTLWESAAQASGRNWSAGPSWLRGWMVIQLLYSVALLLTLGASRDRYLQAVADSRRQSAKFTQ